MERLRNGGLLEQRSSASACGSGQSGGSEQPPLLVRMPPGRVVSLGTCTKACVISFTFGVFVGFTLNRRLRRWVAKMLKQMKDD